MKSIFTLLSVATFVMFAAGHDVSSFTVRGWNFIGTLNRFCSQELDCSGSVPACTSGNSGKTVQDRDSHNGCVAQGCEGGTQFTFNTYTCTNPHTVADFTNLGWTYVGVVDRFCSSELDCSGSVPECNLDNNGKTIQNRATHNGCIAQGCESGSQYAFDTFTCTATGSPTSPSVEPSTNPTNLPSENPTDQPTEQPTDIPTNEPTNAPHSVADFMSYGWTYIGKVNKCDDDDISYDFNCNGEIPECNGVNNGQIIQDHNSLNGCIANVDSCNHDNINISDSQYYSTYNTYNTYYCCACTLSPTNQPSDDPTALPTPQPTLPAVPFCPNLCSNAPCDCDGDDFDPNCKICQLGGCGQCESGYFMASKNYPCMHCQDTMGEGCLFCQDNIGCGQCQTGYSMVKADDCNLNYCVANQ